MCAPASVLSKNLRRWNIVYQLALLAGKQSICYLAHRRVWRSLFPSSLHHSRTWPAKSGHKPLLNRINPDFFRHACKWHTIEGCFPSFPQLINFIDKFLKIEYFFYINHLLICCLLFHIICISQRNKNTSHHPQMAGLSGIL